MANKRSGFLGCLFRKSRGDRPVSPPSELVVQSGRVSLASAQVPPGYAQDVLSGHLTFLESDLGSLEL